MQRALLAGFVGSSDGERCGREGNHGQEQDEGAFLDRRTIPVLFVCFSPLVLSMAACATLTLSTALGSFIRGDDAAPRRAGHDWQLLCAHVEGWLGPGRRTRNPSYRTHPSHCCC